MNIDVFSGFSNGYAPTVKKQNGYQQVQQAVQTTAPQQQVSYQQSPAYSREPNYMTQVPQPVQPQYIEEQPQTQSKTTGQKVKNALPYVLPLAAIPVTAIITHKISSKNASGLKEQISNLTKEVADMKEIQNQAAEAAKKLAEDTASKAKTNNSLLWGALLGISGYAIGKTADDLTDADKAVVAYTAGKSVQKATEDAATAKDIAQKKAAAAGNHLLSKYTQNINGIQLLTNSDSLNKNAKKYENAINNIKTAGAKYLFEPPVQKKITNEHPTVWSVTSEFAPIKEGGLGSVPVEIQNNVTKLGVDIPTFIPMYQQKGIATFSQKGDNATYIYKNKTYNLQKAASFKVDAFQDGKSTSKDVEIYVSTEKDSFDNEKRLVFVKNDDYFNGTIYQTNEKSEEPEKFAFFSKAVYEFAKAKIEPNSVKDLKITDQAAFESVKAPDALILNDWQASPIAAMARYKAPLENAYSQLSDDAAKRISEMNIITIGHNAMYQGSTRTNNDDLQRYQSTSNILNTLFDNFAYDIVSNASSGAVDSDPEDEGLQNLDNVLLLNQDDVHANHTNLLNMGICLSDYFHPVSQNYAEELVSPEHPDLSYELQWALTQKSNAGSLVGIINGNDFNNLSIEAKKDQIKMQTGLDYKTYNKKSTSEEIAEARLDNKLNFYNNFMLPFTKTNDETAVKTDSKVADIKSKTSRLEFVECKKAKPLPLLTDDELAKTPIISSVGRLVSQKGIDVMCDAINLLYKNWDTDFPNKPKPIFYLAGQDGEGGVQRKYIEDLKNKDLTPEDSGRVIFAHGFAPMQAITSASDFFLLPSKFEPCGLTQGESFALATPVIGSAVGGIVDTVNRNGKENGILTDKNEKLTATGFYEAMKEGLDIWFNNPEQYTKMVNDSLAEDFSWIQKGKQGPVFDYLEKVGIDRDKLPDA